MSSITLLPESTAADTVSVSDVQRASALHTPISAPAFMPLEEEGRAHPFSVNQPKPHVGTDGEIVHTVDSLTYLCLMMEPKKTAQQGDLSQCVSPLITRIYHEGEIIDLRLVDGKWAGAEVRVSSVHQRSGLTREPSKKSNGNKRDSGHSEEEQIRRAIWFFITQRYAFKIYNDSGLTGEFPHNRPGLIMELSEKKAERYERIFNKVVLDEVSVRRRSADKNEALRNYMTRRVELIRQGAILVDDPDKPSMTLKEENLLVIRRGRPRTNITFRPAFTQLWDEIEKGQVFLLAATDRSRIARDADLELAFLRMCSRYRVKIQGLVDNLDSMDVSDPLKKGVTYLLGAVYESQLEEITTRTFRGHFLKAERGTGTQKLPWWLRRDNSGTVVIVPEYGVAVRKMIDLYLCGFGIESITRTMARDGLLVRGKYLSTSTVKKTLRLTDRLAGRWTLMGMERNILPAVVDDPTTIAALMAANKISLERHQKMTDGIKWENHLFAGVVKCSCGSHAKWKYQIKQGKKSGEYYGCGKVHRKLDNFPHGAVCEDVLTNFFDELFGANKNFLICHISKMLGGSTHFERMRRREELEKALAEAEAVHEMNAQAVRLEVAKTVKGMGIKEGSPHFETTISSAIAGRTEDTLSAIQSVRASLTMLDNAYGTDGLAVSLTRSLEEMQDWHGMTLLQKNRLLRSLFSKIVIFPRHEGRKIEIYLNGIDQPLPALWLRYSRGQKWRLPTVEEWVGDMMSPPDDEAVRGWFRVDTVRPFYTYLRESGKIVMPQYSKLMPVFEKRRSLRYRPYTKERLMEILEETGIGSDALALFESEWPIYLEAEYALYKARKTEDGEDGPLS